MDSPKFPLYTEPKGLLGFKYWTARRTRKPVSRQYEWINTRLFVYEFDKEKKKKKELYRYAAPMGWKCQSGRRFNALERMQNTWQSVIPKCWRLRPLSNGTWKNGSVCICRNLKTSQKRAAVETDVLRRQKIICSKFKWNELENKSYSEAWCWT